jgi:pre-rRNA-processing protein TSR3
MTNSPTIIIRHRKENLKKCSLNGLENRKDMLFLTYPLIQLPNLDNYILLTLEAPLLTKEDATYGLMLLDASWRYAAQMERKIPFPANMLRRTLPHLMTAYPRKQEDCPSPQRGLASIEALFAAFLLTGRRTEGLLDRYYWKNSFIEKNASSIRF